MNFLRAIFKKTIHSITKRPIIRAAVPRKSHPHTHTHTHLPNCQVQRISMTQNSNKPPMNVMCAMCIHPRKPAQTTHNAMSRYRKRTWWFVHFPSLHSTLLRFDPLKQQKRKERVISDRYQSQAAKQQRSQAAIPSVSQFSVIVLVSEVSRVKSQSSVYLFDVAHDRVCEFQLK